MEKAMALVTVNSNSNQIKSNTLIPCFFFHCPVFCPSRPLSACTDSWEQTSACIHSWLRGRSWWTTMKRRTGSKLVIGGEGTVPNSHKGTFPNGGKGWDHCGKRWRRKRRGKRRRKTDRIKTGALALSRCKGLPYCSSGTKKAVYYTKD